MAWFLPHKILNECFLKKNTWKQVFKHTNKMKFTKYKKCMEKIAYSSSSTIRGASNWLGAVRPPNHHNS